jgi:sporulation integral membrane protein YlbJ
MLRVVVLRKGWMLLTAMAVTLVTLSLVVYPKEGLEAAVEGLKVFWNIVLPSLFPFFVLSELLLGMGVVHFLGVLLEPLMRPVFNVPGVGAFALSMGLAAGYPMDAVITAKFRKTGMCTRIEGERLLAFTNTADPLFMFGAVAVGMFGHPEIGALIALAHYLSAFTVGYLFRFYGRSDRGNRDNRGQDTHRRDEHPKVHILRRAWWALFRARKADGRPLGQLLGEAVKESMMTLFMIGGFIMLFSVFVRILSVVGVMEAITPAIRWILSLFGLSPQLSQSLLCGLLEIDLGTVAVSQAAAPLGQRLVLASAVIAWSGLCVHGQVASVIHGTDIRMGPYVVARLLHAILAGLYTYILMGPMMAVAGAAKPSVTYGPLQGIDRVLLTGKHLLIIIGVLLALAGINYLRSKYAVVSTRKWKRAGRWT